MTCCTYIPANAFKGCSEKYTRLHRAHLWERSRMGLAATKDFYIVSQTYLHYLYLILRQYIQVLFMKISFLTFKKLRLDLINLSLICSRKQQSLEMLHANGFWDQICFFIHIFKFLQRRGISQLISKEILQLSNRDIVVKQQSLTVWANVTKHLKTNHMHFKARKNW